MEGVGARIPAAALGCGPAPTRDVKTRTPRSVGTCDRAQRPRASPAPGLRAPPQGTDPAALRGLGRKSRGGARAGPAPPPPPHPPPTHRKRKGRKGGACPEPLPCSARGGTAGSSWRGARSAQCGPHGPCAVATMSQDGVEVRDACGRAGHPRRMPRGSWGEGGQGRGGLRASWGSLRSPALSPRALAPLPTPSGRRVTAPSPRAK